MITLDHIAERDRVARIVDWRQTPAWLRAALRNAPFEGSDTYEWMTRRSTSTRTQEVRDALLNRAPWSPLVQDEIPKLTWKQAVELAHGKRTAVKTRAVHQDTRVDHGRMLALLAAVGPLVETKLSRVAVAYRAGTQLDEMLCNVLTEIRAPEDDFKFASTLDIRAAYDEVPWDLLDQAITQHLAGQVDQAVLELLRQSYRAEAVDRRGHKIERTRGIPQGHILGPMLLNLYLAGLDRVVARSLATLGCKLWRYCDDFLVAGPTTEALKSATAIIERELQRLRLRVKPETTQIRDLKNPQNPAKWLGYAFTLTGTWVPRERIERKAAELLHKLIRGRLSPDGLAAVLAAIEAHHARVIHPDDAARAALAIRKLITPFMTQPEPKKEKDPLENIRKQLSKKPSVARSQPARIRDHQTHQITLGVVNPATKGNAMILSPEDPRTPPGGSGCEPVRKKPTQVRSVLTHDGYSSTALPGNEGVDHYTPPASSSVTGTSLAVPPPHRATEPTHPDQAAHPGGAIGKNTRVISSMADEPGVAQVTVTAGGVVRTARVRMPGLRSIEETLLHGYRIALCELVPDSEGAEIRMRHPTLVGQVRDHQRIRSPAVMRAWEMLLDEIDRRPTGATTTRTSSRALG